MYYIIDVTLFIMPICKIFVVKFDNKLVLFMNNFIKR